MSKVDDRIFELIAKWRCEASEFGALYRGQVGYNIDTEDLGREWSLDKVADELEAVLAECKDSSKAIAYIEIGAPWENAELVWDVNKGSGLRYRPLFAGQEFHESLEVSEEERKEGRSNWLPIDTAPTDGTLYLASDGESRWIENRPEGHRPGLYEAKTFGWHGLPCDRTAICWQPLAEVPEK